MKPGCAIVILIVVILAAAAAFGVGAWNHEPQPTKKADKDKQAQDYQDNPPEFAGAIDGVLGWASPSIDLSVVTVDGKPVPKDGLITVPKKGGKTVVIHVGKDKGGSDSTRRLRLTLKQPAKPNKKAVQLGYTALGPLPKDMEAPDSDDTALPNPKPGKGREDQAAHLALPIFAAGADISCENLLDQACVIELK